MNPTHREWIEAGLDLALPERFGYTWITSAAYVGGLQADIRNCSGQHIRLSWRADGSTGPVVVNGTHRDDLATYARPGSTLHPFVALAEIIGYGPNAHTDSRVYDWLAANPFKSPPSDDRSTSSEPEGTPAPGPLPSPGCQPGADRGDGRRLTREVMIDEGEYKGWAVRPLDAENFEYKTRYDQRWYDEDYGYNQDLMREMFAAEDRLLAAEDITPEEAARVLSEATGELHEVYTDTGYDPVRCHIAPKGFEWAPIAVLKSGECSASIDGESHRFPTLRAAVDAVLEHIGHPADRTIVHAEHAEEVARNVNVTCRGTIDGKALAESDVWANLERSVKACAEATRQALARLGVGRSEVQGECKPCAEIAKPATLGDVWTLNGETTTDPDGRTLLHGAPVKESPTRTNEDTMPRAEESSAASSALSGWQEEALGMVRRLGAKDNEIEAETGDCYAEMRWRVAGLLFRIVEGWQVAEYPRHLVDCGDPVTAAAYIRDRIGKAHARLGEVLGDD